MTDPHRAVFTTEYSVTVVSDGAPSGLGPSPSIPLESNPWYALHRRAEDVRLAWRRELDRLRIGGVSAELLHHVEAGLSDAEEQLHLAESLGVVGGIDGRVYAQVRETLEGIASATVRLASKDDPHLLASWLAGQGAHLRARLDEWLPHLALSGMERSIPLTLVSSTLVRSDFTGGWVA